MLLKKELYIDGLHEEFIKKNDLIYKKIYAMLENTDHQTWLKIYKLFVHHEDDDMKHKTNYKLTTLIITGRKRYRIKT